MYIFFLLVLFVCLPCVIAQGEGVSVRGQGVVFTQSTSRGRLLKQGQELVFLKTKEKPTQAPGFVDVVAPNIYLVREGSESYHDLVNNQSEKALLDPSFKYTPDILDETWVLATIGYGNLVHPACTFTPFASLTFLGDCTRPVVLELANDPRVVTIDRAPRITLHLLPSRLNITNLSSIPLLFFKPKSLVTVTLTNLLITDTGLDPTHCAFVHHRETRNIPGWTDTLSAAGSHGTAVTGIAVGALCIGIQGITPRGPYVFGDLSPIGGDPESLIVPPGFFDVMFAPIEGVQIHVHSASWGSDQNLGEYSQLSSLLDEYVHSHPYTVHVFAVGNGGAGARGSPPSTAKNVLSVGALTQAGGIASFTSTLPLTDGRVSPLVWAPGTYIWAPVGSQFPPGAAGGPPHYSTFFGTSGSTPIIAAESQQHREYVYLSQGIQTHESLGRAITINHHAAPKEYNPVLPVLGGIIANGVSLPEPQGAWHRCFLVGSTQEDIHIVLVWPDYKAVAFSSHPLVNDLDVIATYEGGMSSSVSGVDTHEGLVIPGGTQAFRLAVYAYENSTVFPPVVFSIYANTSLVEDTSACGTCMPGDTVACDDPEEQKQCMPNGLFTECSSCPLGYIQEEEGCTCSPGVFIRDTTTGELTQACTLSTVTEKAAIAEVNWGESHHNQEFGIFPWLALLFFVL